MALVAPALHPAASHRPELPVSPFTLVPFLQPKLPVFLQPGAGLREAPPHPESSEEPGLFSKSHQIRPQTPPPVLI